MKTLTKKFRAVVHDGLPQEVARGAGRETLLPDDALAFDSAYTFDELRSVLASAGFKVPDVPGEPEQPTYTQVEYANAVESRFDKGGAGIAAMTVLRKLPRMYPA